MKDGSWGEDEDNEVEEVGSPGRGNGQARTREVGTRRESGR